MVYKKVTTIASFYAIIVAAISHFVFANVSVATNDKIYDKTMDILINIQKYSWPIAILVFIYALYEFYVIGSEVIERKIFGQKLIIGIAVFMALLQSMPLLYAFVIVK